MNNPGIDTATWESLRKRWSELEAAGHSLKIEFKLIANPKDEKDILAIDVIQHIDEEVVTETVQRKAGEGYEAVGIAGLSMERLVAVYDDMLDDLYFQQEDRSEMNLIVTMSPSSQTSGELRGYVEKPEEKSSLQLDYRHYYLLNALREKMKAVLGEEWREVRAMFVLRRLEFYFDY